MKNKEKKIKGNILEKNYEWLWQLGINKNCIITSPKYYEDSITKEQREIDVFIEVLDDNENIKEKIMVECRNRKNVQDVTWVEQVITKRNDLNIDRVIMVTTSSFTSPAKIKAKHYNIEIERSSPQSEEFIKSQQENLTGKAQFIFMECTSLFVYSEKGSFNNIQLRQFPQIQKYLKHQIIGFSQSDYFVTELQHKQLSKNNSNFFESANSVLNITFSFIPQPLDDCRNQMMLGLTNYVEEIGKIEKVVFSLSVKPRFIEFPLIRVITIFDDDVKDKTKTNKRHKSSYENDKIRVTFQIHEDKMYNEITLKHPKKYWRYCGGVITLYALLGNVNNEKVVFNITNRPEEILGEIYFGDIL